MTLFTIESHVTWLTLGEYHSSSMINKHHKNDDIWQKKVFRVRTLTLKVSYGEETKVQEINRLGFYSSIYQLLNQVIYFCGHNFAKKHFLTVRSWMMHGWRNGNGSGWCQTARTSREFSLATFVIDRTNGSKK